MVVTSLELPPGLFVVRLAFIVVVVTNIAGQQNRAAWNVPVPPPHGEASCDGGLPFFVVYFYGFVVRVPGCGSGTYLFDEVTSPLFFFILPGTMAELRRVTVFYGTFTVQGLFNDGMPMPVEFAGQQPPNPYPPFSFHLYCQSIGTETCSWHPTLVICPAQLLLASNLSSFLLLFFFFFGSFLLYFHFLPRFRIQDQTIHSYFEWRKRQSQKGNGPFWPWLFLSYPQRWYHF